MNRIVRLVINQPGIGLETAADILNMSPRRLRRLVNYTEDIRITHAQDGLIPYLEVPPPKPPAPPSLEYRVGRLLDRYGIPSGDVIERLAILEGLICVPAPVESLHQ